jgi:hypothetical protein
MIMPSLYRSVFGCDAADAVCPEAPAEPVAAGGAFASGVASETTTVLFASDAGGCPKADVVKNATDANATETLMTAQCTDLRTFSEAPSVDRVMMATSRRQTKCRV